MAEISGLLSLLLKVNLEVCNELLREGSDSSEGGEEGEALASGEIRRGAGLPLSPCPPLVLEIPPLLGMPL